MVIRKGISLRYKILFMLTMLPLVMLGIYLFVALNVFKTDKLAYVYESSTAVAKTLSSQASTDLASLLNSAKPIMQEFVLRRNFAQVSEGILDTDGPIQWLAVYSLENEQTGEFKQIGTTEKDGTSAVNDLASMPNLQSILASTTAKPRQVSVPFKDDRILLVEKVPGTNGDKTLVFLILARVPELASGFHGSSGTENFLLTEEGKVLFGPSGSVDTMLPDRLGTEFFNKLNRQKFSWGAESIRSPAGENLLAGYSIAGFGGTAVLSLVPQSDALKAVKVLVIRSLLFVMVLISATVIVSLFASGNLTSAISDLFRATQSVAEGNFDVHVDVTSQDEIGSLADSFNAMAGEVARLMGETAEKARMESELKTARTVQETLFPPENAEIGRTKISGFYEPASECGGDWWNYCSVDDKIWFWIGDATGHGAAAALITSAAKSASTIIERLNIEPKAAMALMNRSIYGVSHGNVMMTFFLGCYDRTSKKFTYSNASHEGPYLIKKSSKPPKKKDLIPLNDVNGPRLGQNKEMEYEQITIDLEAGDRILFYTDGIPDIQNPDLEAWGEREFVKGILIANSNYPEVDVAVKNLATLFSTFRNGAPLKDDITFFMFQILGDA